MATTRSLLPSLYPADLSSCVTSSVWQNQIESHTHSCFVVLNQHTFTLTFIKERQKRTLVLFLPIPLVYCLIMDHFGCYCTGRGEKLKDRFRFFQFCLQASPRATLVIKNTLSPHPHQWGHCISSVLVLMQREPAEKHRFVQAKKLRLAQLATAQCNVIWQGAVLANQIHASVHLWQITMNSVYYLQS